MILHDLLRCAHGFQSLFGHIKIVFLLHSEYFDDPEPFKIEPGARQDASKLAERGNETPQKPEQPIPNIGCAQEQLSVVGSPSVLFRSFFSNMC